MNKEELIKEINEQLAGLSIIAKASSGLNVEQAVMIYYLQFTLKCKLYELSKEGENV